MTESQIFSCMTWPNWVNKHFVLFEDFLVRAEPYRFVWPCLKKPYSPIRHFLWERAHAQGNTDHVINVVIWHGLSKINQDIYFTHYYLLLIIIYYQLFIIFLLFFIIIIIIYNYYLLAIIYYFLLFTITICYYYLWLFLVTSHFLQAVTELLPPTCPLVPVPFWVYQSLTGLVLSSLDDCRAVGAVMVFVCQEDRSYSYHTRPEMIDFKRHNVSLALNC